MDAEERLPEPVEVAAYYVVAESLTNAAKYAGASNVQVGVDVRGGLLRVAVRDDGRGGADPARGSGLPGLKDRVEAIGGSISLQSPYGKGTTLIAELPLPTGQHRAPMRVARRATGAMLCFCAVTRPRSTPPLQLVGSPGLQQT